MTDWSWGDLVFSLTVCPSLPHQSPVTPTLGLASHLSTPGEEVTHQHRISHYLKNYNLVELVIWKANFVDFLLLLLWKSLDKTT